ncbi:MAG: transketolase [Elusimicrobiota bacterium]
MTTLEKPQIKKLAACADWLRLRCLEATSEAGSGHPSSCLSSADLAAAVFFAAMRYDTANPASSHNDRFVLSKGHAAPLLYACWSLAGIIAPKKLLTLRSIASDLEGHPTPRFPLAEVATGSLGQGLSIGLGMALAARLDQSPSQIYVLMGDGETAEGSVWEAASLAAHYKLGNLTAIIDVNGLGQSQKTMFHFDTDVYSRRFEAFGWRVKAIDGHDFSQILNALKEAKQPNSKPLAIVAKTVKGKGVPFIENKDGWHGKPLKKGEELERALARINSQGKSDLTLPVTMLKPQTKKPQSLSPALALSRPSAPSYKIGDQIATREAYGAALAKLGGADSRVVALDGDTKNSTYSEIFMKSFPDRFIEGFIAEQNLVGMAVGLAARGKIPFVSTFGAFFARAYDQIRMAAISRANVKMAGSHCGVSIGEDGPSQMALEDLAMMRAIPKATVLYPADAVAAEQAVFEAARTPGIVYLRMGRPKNPVIYKADEKFPVGGSKILRQSPKDKVTVVGAGVTVYEALKAHEILAKEGIEIRVIDCYSVKPIDEAALKAAARETGRVLIVEDHYPEGGLGDAALAALAGERVAVKKLAVSDIPRSGKPQELIEAYGISAWHIAQAVRRF